MNGRTDGSNGRRPTRAEVDPAALELLASHGPQILGTARRYSANLDDAEDAYQRGLEILLTKAPTTREEELVPWLKTVVKHEAFAIRRERARAAPSDDGEPLDPEARGPGTHDRSEHYERLRFGAEAMRELKPQEVRCLLLRAEGFSYDQICELTGFSYTKVNRCVTEGRRAFLARVKGIESGAACERAAPLLSALADGEASAADLAALRPHLKGCLACRARLKEYRAVPARVAALVPPAALVAEADGSGPVSRATEALVGAVQDRAAALADKLQPATELATGQKVAALGATAAVLAGGGGTTVDELGADERGRGEQPPARVRAAEEAVKQPAPPAPASRSGTAQPQRDQSASSGPAQVQKVTPPARPAAGPSAPRATAPPPPPAEAEFSPGVASGSPAADSSPAPSSSSSGSSTSSPPPPSGGAGEFGP